MSYPKPTLESKWDIIIVVVAGFEVEMRVLRVTKTMRWVDIEMNKSSTIGRIPFLVELIPVRYNVEKV